MSSVAVAGVGEDGGGSVSQEQRHGKSGDGRCKDRTGDLAFGLRIGLGLGLNFGLA